MILFHHQRLFDARKCARFLSLVDAPVLDKILYLIYIVN